MPDWYRAAVSNHELQLVLLSADKHAAGIVDFPYRQFGLVRRRNPYCWYTPARSATTPILMSSAATAAALNRYARRSRTARASRFEFVIAFSPDVFCIFCHIVTFINSGLIQQTALSMARSHVARF